MKNIRHMTLEEYKELVVPKIVELKNIIRKKYLRSAEFSGLMHLSLPDYLDYQVKKYSKHENPDEAWERGYYRKNWNSSGLKSDPIPTELYDSYKEIFEELSPLFINERHAELNKLHKDHKAEIRRAIDKDVYVKELKAGEITFDELEPICDSVGVRIPKRVLELKEKVEQGMYTRAYVNANAVFLKSIREFLTPYSDELKASKRSHIMRAVDMFESQTKSLYDFWAIEKKSNDIYTELSMLFANGSRSRAADFDTKLNRVCDHYAESYIRTFIGRLESKVNIVNVNWGIPTIEFATDCRFTGGELNVTFKLTYPNGEYITGDSKVIVAGGYIQCLHQRYLFHFWYNGNQVSLEQMDQLK